MILHRIDYNGGDIWVDKDKDFEAFGYDTEKPCQVCGEKPAKVEPRFLYIVCKEHQYMTPVEMSNIKL